MNPLISVITINLNNKDGLERTIKSFLAQKARNQVEYIVVDGKSSDGSDEVIQIHQEDIDVISIEKDNGIYNAMNRGLNLAKGNYTYFLNSGDEFKDDNVLDFVLSTIDITKNKYNIIAGQVDVYKDNELIKTTDLRPWVPHQGAFVKTNLLKLYKFDESYRINGDLDLFTRMKNSGEYTVLYIENTIANFKVGGLGNNPKYTLIQYKDRILYSIKNNLLHQIPFVTFSTIINFSIYSLFGDEALYVFQMKTMNTRALIKKLLHFH
jgi:glycosyltransferase involved in cell wall biosynthesis